MANLFPSIFPYAPDSPEMKKLGFQTEFEVYTKLGSIYDETVDILCEPKFIKRDYFGRMRDGEYTDFIILHPQKGLVFLECKGGLVTYNAKEGKCYQEDNLLRESPIKQAEGGKRILLGLLNAPHNKKKINIEAVPTIHGAIFPNTPKPHGVTFGTNIKPEMIIWAEDFNNLEKSVTKLLNLNKSEYQLTENDRKLIRTILYGEDLKSPFKKVLKFGEHMQDLEFDQDQQSFLLSIFRNSKMIVDGLAGTGKTIIAAKIATHEEYKDKKVLMLTKTKGLCQFLKVLIRNGSTSNNLRIYSIDQFVKKTADRLSVPMTLPGYKATKEELNEHFDNYSPQRCQQIFDMHPVEKFDLLIIDESQDFHKNWFESLSSIIKEDGKIFFFYDPLQTTIPNSMTEILKKPDEIGFPTFSFNANYRNTSSISNLLSKLIKKYFPDTKLFYSKHSKVNKGRKPELIEADSFEKIIGKTIEKVDFLIKEEKFKPRDIGVLGIDSMKPSVYGTKLSMTNELKKLDLKVIGAWDYSLPYMDPKEENDITFSDVRSFKGLEKRVIILVNFAELNEKSVQQIYTGLSRARGDLIVISNQKSINQIKELL